MTIAKELSVNISANTGAVQAIADDLASRLESWDTLERIDQGLRARFENALAGGGVDELCCLGVTRTDETGDLVIDVSPSELLLDVVAAVRALQRDGAHG